MFFFVVNLTFGEVGIGEFDFFVEDGKLLVSLDELGAEDVALVSDHVVVFLLFGFLLFGLLDDFLEVADVVLLVLDDLLCGLNLGLCPVLVCLDLHVLRLDFFVLFVEFYKLLILGLDLVSQLLNLESHSFVLFL